jgi:hypothetical protein
MDSQARISIGDDQGLLTDHSEEPPVRSRKARFDCVPLASIFALLLFFALYSIALASFVKRGCSSPCTQRHPIVYCESTKPSYCSPKHVTKRPKRLLMALSAKRRKSLMLPSSVAMSTRALLDRSLIKHGRISCSTPIFVYQAKNWPNQAWNLFPLKTAQATTASSMFFINCIVW